jgi:asparagine synthase (glutamine-hydrolysing)
MLAGVFGQKAGDRGVSIDAALQGVEMFVPTRQESRARPHFAVGSLLHTYTGGSSFNAADGSLHVCFSGELYNVAALRDELSRLGRTCESDCPPGLLALLYLERGRHFLEGVKGRFALALYDEREGRLILARDASGLKPLFVTRADGQLVFASDTRLLKKLVGELRPSPQAVMQYLVFNYPLCPETFYEGVQSLPPGAALMQKLGESPEVFSYAAVPLEVEFDDRRSYQEALARVIQSQTAGPLPVGFHLSGGLDTSLLCHLAAARALTPLETFTAFYESDHEDIRYSELVAEEIKARPHFVRVLPEEAREQLPLIVRLMDSPLMAVGVPTFWFLAKAARESGVRAVVSGIGGDHPFIGTNRLPESAAEGASEEELSAPAPTSSLGRC